MTKEYVRVIVYRSLQLQQIIFEQQNRNSQTTAILPLHLFSLFDSYSWSRITATPRLAANFKFRYL